MRISWEKCLHQTRRLAKFGAGLLRPRMSLDQKAILFILGCQRSGTTLTTHVFERDWQARVFPEESRLSSDDIRQRIRLNDLEKVVAALDDEPYPFLIAKPLVESQNAVRLLERIPNSRVLWLYRPVQDVVASDLRLFGARNGIDNIRPIAQGDESNWRAERASAETRDIIARHFAEDMQIHDAAALFWLARNRLYFENGLDRLPLRSRVMLLRYEQLVAEPEDTMREVYAFAGRPFPGPHLVAEVRPDSVGKGAAVRLSPEISHLCRDLLERLDAASRFTAAAGRIPAARTGMPP